MRLTQTEVDNFVDLIMRDEITLEKLMEQLRFKGIPEAEMKAELQNINNYLKIRLAKAKTEDENNAANVSGGALLIFIVAFCGVAFGVSSFVGHAIVVALVALIGYYSNKKNPWVSIVGGIVFYMAALYIYPLYFSGRSRAMRIELLIVAAISAIPAFLAAFLVTKITQKDDGQ